MISSEQIPSRLGEGPNKDASEASKSPYEEYMEHLDEIEAGKLCWYITGLMIDDIDLHDRTLLDHEFLRGKYGLPDWDARVEDSSWYESFLLDLAEREKVTLVDPSEYSIYFTQHPHAAAVFFDDTRRTSIKIDKSDKPAYEKSIGIVEHELIHAIQERTTPYMPPEVREYEAYTAGANPFALLFTPGYLNHMFEDMLSSVVGYYSYLSERLRRPIVPEWSSVEYFANRMNDAAIATFSPQDRELFESLKIDPELLNDSGGSAEMNIPESNQEG